MDLSRKQLKPIEILEQMIHQSGNCDNLAPSNCKECPLSKLKQKPDGSYINCIEATGTEKMSVQEADAIYLETAKRKLADIKVHEMLEEEDVSK